LLAHASTTVQIGAAGVFCGLGHAFVFPILSAMVVTRAHADNRGVAMTLFTSLFDVGLASAPLLGFVIEGSGYTAMFTVAASVAAAFAVGFFVIDGRWVQSEIQPTIRHL
jgi:predicted MFS family arabinose efflux permease